jgi:hypothetical protein
MIRFISFLLGRPYDPCKGCAILQHQLLIANEDRERLTNVLLQILQPKAVESAPVEINQIAQSSALFSRRRAALEERDRQEAAIKKNSTNIGRPDDSLKDINKLETELGIEEEKTN